MNFYDKMEDIDSYNLEQFNNKIKWFKELNRTEKYNRIDFFCVDRKNRNVSVELKTRTTHINTYETIFIEPDKYEALMEKYNNEGYVPLYINFMQDSFHVLVFDLRKFNYENIEIVSKIITDKGDNKVKKVDRMLLDIKRGHYYEFNKNKNKYEMVW